MRRRRFDAAFARAQVDADFARFQARCEAWAADRLDGLPRHWRKRAAGEFLARGGAARAEANAWLRDLAELAAGRVSIAAGDDELRHVARQAAASGYALARLSGAGDVPAVLRVLVGHCAAWGLVPPVQEGEAAVKRLLCARWWLRRLRAAVARRCEAAAIAARLVCRSVWPYASQDGVERRGQQRARNAAAVARAELLDCDSGEVCALADVVRGSVANPAVRRGELMVRVRGVEEWATGQGHGAEFWTLTTPSRFHAQRIDGATCAPNPAFDGSTPAEARGYIASVWARARAAWARRGLCVYGLRVAEPHHDATPHWHVLVFGARRDLRFARRLLAVYARRDSPNEPGAARHRFTAVTIDPQKGNAAGYVAKYVAKNIDSFGMEDGRDAETGRRQSAMVRRCDAWAAAWRIRQFQFFGVPGVCVWRALRKLPGAVSAPGVEAARQAADAGDFAAYCVAMGGCAMARRDCRVWLVREAQGRLTAYGDAGARLPVALAASCGGAVPLLRRHFVLRWGGIQEGFRGSRTGVNNCTGAPVAPEVASVGSSAGTSVEIKFVDDLLNLFYCSDG